MPIGINRTYSWEIGDYNTAAGSIYIIDEGGFPVEECVLTGTTYTTATLQYEVNSGYKLTHIWFYDAHDTYLFEMEVDLTGSGQVTTGEVHPMTGGDYTVIVTPTFEEVPTEGGGSQMIMSTLQDQNGNSYDVTDIQTLTGSEGGGPFNMTDIDTIGCGENIYSIEHAHAITSMVVGANGVQSVYGGTANTNKTSAYPGEEIIPSYNLSSGYQFLGLQIYNADTMDYDSDLTDEYGSLGTFTMPNYNVLVMVITNAEYDIVVDSDHGTVDVVSKAIEDQSVDVDIIPDAGYQAATYMVENVDESSSEYGEQIQTGAFHNPGTQGMTFSMPAAKVKIYVTYSTLPSYDITYDTSGIGQVTGPDSAVANTTVEITIKPSTYMNASTKKFKVESSTGTVLINETNLGKGTKTRTFTMPNADVLITTEFGL